MGKSGVLDKYCQWALLEVPGTANAAGTTIQRLQTGITTMQKTAWELNRIEYRFPAVWLRNATLLIPADYIRLGITQSINPAQAADFNNPSMLDLVEYASGEQITAAGILKYREAPLIHDFGANPILALPSSLQAILSWSLAVAITTDLCQIRAWYREVELGPEDWYDLLQLRLPLGAI